MFEPPNRFAPARPAAPPWTSLLMAVAVLAIAPAASADTSFIGELNETGERAQSQVLEGINGFPFGQGSNESVGVKQIDEQTAAEQIFNSGLGSAGGRASGSTDWNGDELEALVQTDGGNADVADSQELTGDGLRNAVLALRSSDGVGQSPGTDNLDPFNAGGRVGDDADRRSFVLFWEDAENPQHDFDYNDLAVELAGSRVAGRPTTNVLIPLPAAAWSGFSVLGGVSLMAAFRRIRKRLG